jgi:hypothetical protein
MFSITPPEPPLLPKLLPTEAPSKVVAMCEHNSRLFVATERVIYERLGDGKLHPLIFA